MMNGRRMPVQRISGMQTADFVHPIPNLLGKCKKNSFAFKNSNGHKNRLRSAVSCVNIINVYIGLLRQVLPV